MRPAKDVSGTRTTQFEPKDATDDVLQRVRTFVGLTVGLKSEEFISYCISIS